MASSDSACLFVILDGCSHGDADVVGIDIGDDMMHVMVLVFQEG